MIGLCLSHVCGRCPAGNTTKKIIACDYVCLKCVARYGTKDTDTTKKIIACDYVSLKCVARYGTKDIVTAVCSLIGFRLDWIIISRVSSHFSTLYRLIYM